MTKSKENLLAATELILFDKYDEVEAHKREIVMLTDEYKGDIAAGKTIEELSENLHLIYLLDGHVNKIEALLDVLNNDMDHAALEMMDAES